MDVSPVLFVFLGLIALAFISALWWQAKENARIARKRLLYKLKGTYYRGHED